MRNSLVVLLFASTSATIARADDAPQPTTPEAPEAPEKETQPPPPDEQPPDEQPPDEQPPDEHDRADIHEDNEFGPLVQIEGIEITGNTATQTEIIRRALPVAPGDVLHSSDRRLRNVRFKILALGYFRDVTVAMHKGSERGKVIVDVKVVERGTTVLNRLWFGTNDVSPYYLGLDIGDRNILGMGIALGGGFIYAAPGDVPNSRAQWAGEIRVGDGSLLGSRFGANASLTLVHGSEPFRVAGDDEDTSALDQRAFSYRRFGSRGGMTYDITALSRLSAGLRLEQIDAELPTAPTQTLPNGEISNVDLHLQNGGSHVVTLSAGFDRDTRPDPVLPHAGGRFTAALELGSAAIGSSYDYATFFARYEHWWPFHREHHTFGIRLAGGLVLGNAPRFDRIHVSDVDHFLTPRALGLVLSTASPFDVLNTRDDKPSYGDLGASATAEYAIQLFRGKGKNRVYGGDLFFAAGLWGLAENDDLHLRDSSVYSSLPIDVFADAGIRLDTDIGVFELTFSNALGRLR